MMSAPQPFPIVSKNGLATCPSSASNEVSAPREPKSSKAPGKRSNRCCGQNACAWTAAISAVVFAILLSVALRIYCHFAAAEFVKNETILRSSHLIWIIPALSNLILLLAGIVTMVGLCIRKPNVLWAYVGLMAGVCVLDLVCCGFVVLMCVYWREKMDPNAMIVNVIVFSVVGSSKIFGQLCSMASIGGCIVALKIRAQEVNGEQGKADCEATPED
ncbi:hypothetical protein L596_018286 [Steinernema carpocapsae]|uniref:Uncharacterized protein n=1 Tax=Steinernema carpocapsae TaxID=34508 RepID=A0A4U5N481_STECR|nr:hypothetical protein L596_018286 [Steinernema carpocapsae]